MRDAVVLWIALGLVLVACGDDVSETRDAGPGDAGGLDAGARDAGESDAGSGTDAGSVDAGALDAGALDAGELDGGELDGGEGDAGHGDAGADAGPSTCGASGGACDIALQDCPDDYACYFAEVDGVSTTRCELVFYAGMDGDPCEFADECGPGLTCRAGTCRQYCCPDAALGCPGVQACVRLAEAPNIGHCAPPEDCTLVPSSGCNPGQGCYPSPAPPAVGCFAAGTLPEGAACAATNECAPGTVCLGEPGAYSCLRICRSALGTADCVDPLHVCHPIPGSLPDGFGVCDRP